MLAIVDHITSSGWLTTNIILATVSVVAVTLYFKMSSRAKMAPDKHIVIIGAGYAGLRLGYILKGKGANFTIVDAKDAFHHNVGSVRAIVEPGFAEKLFIPLHDVFGNCFKHGKVKCINQSQKQISLENGEELSYDILVIATGSRGSFPSKVDYKNQEESVDLYQNYQRKVESSARIAVIGGGAVGVEVAAEIATDFPQKEVTLIHSNDVLIGPNMTPKFRRRTAEILQRLRVKVVLGEVVTNLADIHEVEQGPSVISTDKGSSIEVDCVIPCIGLTPNADAYRDSLTFALEENGSLKVNEYFQVEGCEDVYAFGDCASIKEAKLAFLANRQADHLAKNLMNVFNKKALKAYNADGHPFKMAISLGRNSGLGETKNGMILGEFLTKYIKSRDLFVGKTWKGIGLKPPK